MRHVHMGYCRNDGKIADDALHLGTNSRQREQLPRLQAIDISSSETLNSAGIRYQFTGQNMTRRTSIWKVLPIGMVMAAAQTVSAQDFFPEKREFLVERACDATRAIRTKSEPEALTVGIGYPARGLNRKSDPTHAFIVVGDQSKWVELTCGRFRDGDPVSSTETTASRRSAAPGGTCLAFFDAIDKKDPGLAFGGSVDMSPPPPPLDEFDRDLAKTCGEPGKVVGREEFRSMMRRNSGVLDRIRGFTRGKVFASRPARTSAEDYLADLTEAWFAIKAFDHIFCGEPSSAGGGKIGGLHFHARYLALQEQGLACRMNNFSQNEAVDSVIYTMGVEMRLPDGRIVRDARKGYGYTLSGEDLLKVVTRAFSENPSTSGESQGCILPIADDGKSFKAVFVRRATGIRTFYPDATPNGRGDRINPPCTSEIRLQP